MPSTPQRAARLAGAAFLALAAHQAQAAAPIKVGFMLPYSGTYAALGTA
ncbi:ABC transporter permease, partial [Bordetella hinzii]|nr:ABC transporter permease [Bordetella hinzii]